MPGGDGSRYVSYSERTGESSPVYFTRDLSGAGLEKIFERVGGVLQGKIAVKLHTGEEGGPNIIPRPWVKKLIADRLPGATIVETNTYYAEAVRDIKPGWTPDKYNTFPGRNAI